jgi:hypothetical protein
VRWSALGTTEDEFVNLRTRSAEWHPFDLLPAIPPVEQDCSLRPRCLDDVEHLTVAALDRSAPCLFEEVPSHAFAAGFRVDQSAGRSGVSFATSAMTGRDVSAFSATCPTIRSSRTATHAATGLGLVMNLAKSRSGKKMG